MVLPFFTLEKNAPYCVNSIVKRVRKVNELNRQNPVSRGLNCTPFVRQYDILNNKWGALLCRKEYQTNAIHQNSRSR